MDTKCNRRDFLKASLSSLAYFSTAATVPNWIAKSAVAASKEISGDKILVLVQLAGGNDGLNTVIPYTDPLYNGDELRPRLHITSGLEPTTIDSLNALHPKLIRLKNWHSNGNVAIMQNCGYPNPNLSHFVSTKLWELGTSPGSALETDQGWASRFFDNQCAGVPADQIDPLTIVMGGRSDLPLTLSGSDHYVPPAVDRFSSYKIAAPNNDAGAHRKDYIRLLNSAPTVDSKIDFLQRSANTAQASVDNIATASEIEAISEYPSGSFGDGLDIASRVIRAGFETKIFYVRQGGYDTHSGQSAGDPANNGKHADLMDQFDQGIDAFLTDMALSGNLDRVLVLTFSEFGRRVGENGSLGTDHGAGNSLFAMGGRVHSGIYGGQPDLEDLTRGNLKHRIDFRSVYSRVMMDWFGVDPEPIFGSDDFNDPIFDIPAGIEEVPFIKTGAGGGSEGLDVDGSGGVSIVDLQHVVNDVLGRDVEHNTDVNNDGKTNIVDVQDVVNGILDQ